MGTNNDPDYEKVTIGGIEYLTFPDSVKYINIKRETLQQQVNRKTLDVKKIGKYLFVPFKKCEELRERGENDKKLVQFKELVDMDISVEELQKWIEEKKNQKSSEGK
jgi:hypothetical protein